MPCFREGGIKGTRDADMSTSAAKSSPNVVDPVIEAFRRGRRVTKPQTPGRVARRLLALAELEAGEFATLDVWQKSQQ